MSKTFRRKGYESTCGKIKGSKISGDKYYTQANYVYYNHPYKKRKKAVMINDLFSINHYKYELTNEPEIVIFWVYSSCPLKEKKIQYSKLHSDNGKLYSGCPSSYSRTYNKRLKNKYKEYIYKYVRLGKENTPLPSFIRNSASYDY